jgi:signal transduction histidine kinase
MEDKKASDTNTHIMRIRPKKGKIDTEQINEVTKKVGTVANPELAAEIQQVLRQARHADTKYVKQALDTTVGSFWKYEVRKSDDGEMEVILRDRTEERQETREKDEIITHLQRSQFLYEQIGVVMHEMRNVFTAAIGGLSMIVRSCDMSENEREKAEMILKQCTRGIRLSENVLDVHRDGDYDLNPLLVTRSIDDIVELIKKSYQQNGVVIARNYQEKLPSVLGNSEFLQALWINILKNAYEEQCKTITIDVMEYNAEKVLVNVNDDGPGMNPEALAAWNSEKDLKYVSRKPGGNAIGMQVTKNIMKKHRGYLDVKSKPGSTDFSFYFKIA